MTLHVLKVLLLLNVAVPQLETLHPGPYLPAYPPRFRVRLEDDERLIVPKSAVVELVPAFARLVDKSSPPRPRHRPPPRKLTVFPDGYGSVLEKKPGGFFMRPSLSTGPTPRHRPEFEDVKPVTEHIEDDLKYDFRTNTHSV